MTIQVDSREKAKAIKKILATFDDMGIRHYTSKLFVGDYMALDNPMVIVDRKQNLIEICGNVCQEHERFRAELIRAQENGIHLVILCEHGDGIETMEDVIFWSNPRSTKRVKVNGRWTTIETKAMKGEVLYRIMKTMTDKYGVEWQFCNKDETGKRILEILGYECEDD